MNISNQTISVPSENVIIGFVLNCQPFPNTNKSIRLIAADTELYQRIKEVIPADPNRLVFFNKAINKIIVHAPENILPGYHEFSIDTNTPKISYVGPADAEYTNNPLKNGDRVLIVGKKNNGAFAMYLHESGNSVVVQFDSGDKFNPSPKYVKAVKPKRRTPPEIRQPFTVVQPPSVKTQQTPTSLQLSSIPVVTTGQRVESLSPQASSLSPRPSIGSSLSMKSVEDSIREINSSSSKEDTDSNDYSQVDLEKSEKIPIGNYDYKTDEYKRLSKYPTVEISKNLTEEVYTRMKSQDISVHIDARKYPIKISESNWVREVNAYMKRRQYRDPREGYLINPRSSSYYELWECRGGFDFMRFYRSLKRRNGGVRYGHVCNLSIIMDNTWYLVKFYM